MTGSRITQGLRRAAQINPSGVATIDGASRRSWREVLSRVAEAAGVLRGAGLSDGGRVALLAHNSHRYFELYYAIPWAGGAIVPLNTRLALPEMQYILEDSGAEILIVDDSFVTMAQAMRERVPSLRSFVHISDGPAPPRFCKLRAACQGWRACPGCRPAWQRSCRNFLYRREHRPCEGRHA